MNIELPKAAIKAVSHCMSKADVRYYLNGILIEVSGETATLVATSGHTLAAYHVELDHDAGEGKWIIPESDIREAVRWKTDVVHLQDGPGGLYLKNGSKSI